MIRLKPTGAFLVIAVDPDLHGGIAGVAYPERRIVSLRDMPVCSVPDGDVIDPRELKAIFDSAVAYAALPEPPVFVIERAIVKPQAGRAGAAMTAGIGRIHQNYATVRTVALLAPHREIRYAWPSSWKKGMGLTNNKDASRERAAALFPGHAAVFTKKKAHGLAEALLLAEWGAGMNLGAKEG